MATISTMEFLQALYSDPVRPGSLLVWTASRTSGKRRSHWLHTLREAATQAHRQRRSRETYFGVALHDAKKARTIARQRWPKVQLPSIRGCEDSVVALPALWADIDVRGAPGRGVAGGGVAGRGMAGSSRLVGPMPPDRAAALQLLQAVPVPASIIVRSGGGYHVYWLLREPWILENDTDRDRAKRLLRRLQGALHAAARSRGWVVDHSADLARLLRLPGTFNLKWPGRPSVSVEHFPLITAPGAGRAGDFRYELEDFDSIPELPEPPVIAHLLRGAPLEGKTPEPADFVPIAEGCGFIQRCLKNPVRVSKREYEAVVDLAGHSSLGVLDNRGLIHLISEAHPGYNPLKTEELLAQVLRRPGPHTCRQIDGFSGPGEGSCHVCPHFGRIESPIDLGRVSPSQAGLRAVRPKEVSATPPTPPEPMPVQPQPVPALGSQPRREPYDPRPATQVEIAPDPGPSAGTVVLLDPLEATEATTIHDLIRGLAELLVDLGGPASAREMLQHLTASGAEAFPLLRSALADLFPRLRRGQLPRPIQLAGRLRAYRGRIVGGACIDRASKSYQGVRWTVRKIGVRHAR